MCEKKRLRHAGVLTASKWILATARATFDAIKSATVHSWIGGSSHGQVSTFGAGLYAVLVCNKEKRAGAPWTCVKVGSMPIGTVPGTKRANPVS